MSRALASLVFLFLGLHKSALGLQGATQCTFGSPDCNVCAEEISRQFNELKHHGEVLGFHMGTYSDDVSFGSNHWQGIVRLSTGNGKFLALSTGKDNGGGKVRVVEMASRNGDGKRFRSNRLKKKTDTDDTAPPTTDKIVAGSTPNSTFLHGGGMDTVGKYMAVPLDQPKKGATGSEIVFYDMSNPKSPRISRRIVRGSKAAGSVGVTRLSNDKYLVAVSGFDGAYKLDLYFIDSLDGTDYKSKPDQTLDFKYGSDLLSGCWPHDTSGSGCGWSFQGFSLVNQCDGKVFLIGMQYSNRYGTAGGADYASLYELIEQNGRIKLMQAGVRKHFYCNWSKSGHPCNFAASGSAFVDSDKNLILYSSEHGKDGPDSTVKFVEFRNMYGNRQHSCAESGSSWIELYENDSFKGRSVVLDYVDRSKDSFDDLKHLDKFTDKTSSMMWCLRSGCRGTIYWDDGFSGRSIQLHSGLGQRHDMPRVKWYGKNWNDEISSVKLSGNC